MIIKNHLCMYLLLLKDLLRLLFIRACAGLYFVINEILADINTAVASKQVDMTERIDATENVASELFRL